MESIQAPDRDLEVLYVNDQGDYETTSTGIRVDNSPRTKALLALKAHRGQYWADKEYGSRFYLIKTLEQGQKLSQDYADEALQFMIDRGEILSVEVTEVKADPENGGLRILLLVTVTEDDIVDIIITREQP